ANADPIIILPFFLFLLKTFLVVIGAFFLCRGLALLFIKSIRMQRMLILSYLNAVLHYAKPESGDKLPEINMDYSIVDIEKTSHIKSFLKKYFPKLFGSESKPLCIKLLERCPLWHKLSEVTHPETKPDASTAIPTPDRDLEKAPSCIKLLDQCPLWCKLNEAAPPETASTNPKPDCDPTS
ncbi:MAG: hypothetical protein LBL36_01300, partial [Clostridiales Family XIII bacterium]|nr:hypothetical protein [Clostridiales Family XIII bacterium]